MRLSSLANLLSGKLSSCTFSAEIAGELAVYVLSLQNPMAIVQIQITEDIDLLLDRPALAVLCRLFAAGELTADELAYAADVAQLSERVEFNDPEIAGNLAECTDPDINGPLTVARALEIAEIGTVA